MEVRGLASNLLTFSRESSNSDLRQEDVESTSESSNSDPRQKTSAATSFPPGYIAFEKKRREYWLSGIWSSTFQKLKLHEKRSRKGTLQSILQVWSTVLSLCLAIKFGKCDLNFSLSQRIEFCSHTSLPNYDATQRELKCIYFCSLFSSKLSEILLKETTSGTFTN